MPPELLTACETVFQEHKTSNLPVKWNSDTFRGRISIGLSEMAKETLVSKNIIILPNKAKKIITQLNPVVAAAASFEEAEKMIINKTPALATSLAYDPETYISEHVYGFAKTPTRYSHRLMPIADESEIPMAVTEMKWYLKPFFYYVVWPLCAAAAGILVSLLIDFAFTELFLDPKY